MPWSLKSVSRKKQKHRTPQPVHRFHEGHPPHLQFTFQYSLHVQPLPNEAQTRKRADARHCHHRNISKRSETITLLLHGNVFSFHSLAHGTWNRFSYFGFAKKAAEHKKPVKPKCRPKSCCQNIGIKDTFSIILQSFAFASPFKTTIHMS